MPTKRTRPKKDEDSSTAKKSEVKAIKPPSKKRKGQQEGCLISIPPLLD